MSKITVEIDFEDLIEDIKGDNDASLSSEIRANIINQASNLVRQKCVSDIEKQVGIAVKEIIETKISHMIEEKIATIMNDPETKVQKNHYNTELYSVKSLILEQIGTSLNNGKVVDVVHQRMKNHIEDLKNTYDLAFASTVVNALHEKGMLNHDGLKLLMENKT